MQLASTLEPVTPMIDRMLARSAEGPVSPDFFDRLGEQLDRAGRRLQEIADGGEGVVAAAREVAPADLEKLIGRIEDLEESIGAELHALRSDQERWAMSLRRNPPAIRRRFSALIRRHEENMVRAAEAIRDVRWRLLGFQARTDDEGDAPAFDDPDALERYLGTL